MRSVFHTFWFRACLCFFAGTLITLSLAPVNIWPVAVLSLALFFFIIHYAQKKASYLLAWLFGLGQYLSGVSWVYVSIHDQSNTPAAIAIPLTFLWCAFLALFCLLFAYAYKLLIPSHTEKYRAVFAAPALWVLIDWLRSWLLSGFPWLYIGHSQIDTPLAGWVPIAGVFAASFTLALCASIFLYATQQRQFKNTALLTSLVVVVFSSGFLLRQVNWTQPTTRVLSTSLIQANIPQETKWLPSQRDAILQRYAAILMHHMQKNHLYIFPETALPDYYSELKPLLADFEKRLNSAHSALLTGIVYSDEYSLKIYNSIISLGSGKTRLYHKRHLVPFGEYIPIVWLRNLLTFFNLPMSDFSPGPTTKVFFHSQSIKLAPFICYEIAYPSLVRATADEADILLTVSNDTWFGNSLAPHQHMQFAQFRALENGRYLIRATNNGISAIVNEKGLITQRLPQFKADVLTAKVPAFKGQTFYNRFGDIPILLLCSAAILITALKTFTTPK